MDSVRQLVASRPDFFANRAAWLDRAVRWGPTPYILLTQGHVDHVGGVRLFREPGTALIAQCNNRACQADDARIRGVRNRQAYIWFKSAFDASAKAGAEQPAIATQDEPFPD